MRGAADCVNSKKYLFRGMVTIPRSLEEIACLKMLLLTCGITLNLAIIRHTEMRSNFRSAKDRVKNDLIRGTIFNLRSVEERVSSKMHLLICGMTPNLATIQHTEIQSNSKSAKGCMNLKKDLIRSIILNLSSVEERVSSKMHLIYGMTPNLAAKMALRLKTRSGTSNRAIVSSIRGNQSSNRHPEFQDRCEISGMK